MKSNKPKPDLKNPYVNGKQLTERLQFEELVVNVLEKLAHVSPHQMDEAIARSLSLICTFFGVHYCGLLEIPADARKIRVLQMSNEKEPETNISGINIAPLYPQAYDRAFDEKEPIIFLPPESFPPLEDPDIDTRHLWELLKALNLRIIPLKFDGKVTHAMGMWSTSSAWKWLPMYTDRLRLLGEIALRALSHKRDYNALRENQKILTETQRIANLGSWNWNIITGNIAWSDETYRIFGFQPQAFAMTYQTLLTWVHPDDRETLKKAINESLTDRQKNYDIEHRLVRPDGSERIVHGRGEVVYDIQGKPACMMGTVLDITERKQAEILLEKALEEVRIHRKQLEAENIYLRDEIGAGTGFAHIVGTSESIRRIMVRIEQVANTDTTVLFTGETGTGKGIFARALHDFGNRQNKPFVQVNCAGLPANLIESELFGRERGAFTGATEKQIGRFELAHGGTIFLDEIGELPIELQAKLLRVLENGEFERLGSPRTVTVDVRVIASTNRNLTEQIKKGQFRSDLFYRLNVFPIKIPPLRERKQDIPLLVNYYVEKFNKRCNKYITSLARETLEALQTYNWPGNVRELINIIERAVIISNGPVLHIGDHLEVLPPPTPEKMHEMKKETTMNHLSEVQRQHILETLMKTGWKIEGTNGSAEILGMKPSTLRARMKKLQVTRPGR